ncbi:PaaI family thioesterase [Peribacillus saganii]|uniref:PaaI family thioesterase n=1 Tax=Peribacillus saganii TaxID=2303992 RepID=A0A372LAM0_9BACI|nr:PaaI family thioesterase [Peribacillus saganii]RFU62796.1 PaaI family thioesterase [Peribacillus saganii]
MLTERLKALTTSPVWLHTGMELEFAEDGKSKVVLQVKQELLQIHGTVHGGILATLLDAAMASAVNSVLDENLFTVTAEMKIHFTKPASGNYLIGMGEIVKHGKSLTFIKSEIFDEHGEMVAFGSGTFVNRMKKNV